MHLFKAQISQAQFKKPMNQQENDKQLYFFIPLYLRLVHMIVRILTTKN